MPIETGYVKCWPDAFARQGDNVVGNKHEEIQKVFKKYLGGSVFDNIWQVIDTTDQDEDDDDRVQCMCSHDHLQQLFLVKNLVNEKLAVVGSECIKKFNNDELNRQVSAFRKGNVCRGKKPIDRRTREGKLGRCDDEGCTCHIPHCIICHEYEDECTCARCRKCKWPVHACRCARCFHGETGQFKHFKDECTCPKCPKCKKSKKDCRHGACGKLCYDCKCKTCKRKCNACICNKNCPRCFSMMMVCLCKRCAKCTELMEENEEEWKTKCLPCWRIDKNII